MQTLNETGKTAFVPLNPEKGKMSMGHMVELGWKTMEYSTHPGETILLVGKCTGMPNATSGGFAPQTAGVGQMKLEAPPRYSRKRQLGVRVCLPRWRDI